MGARSDGIGHRRTAPVACRGSTIRTLARRLGTPAQPRRAAPRGGLAVAVGRRPGGRSESRGDDHRARVDLVVEFGVPPGGRPRARPVRCPASPGGPRRGADPRPAAGGEDPSECRAEPGCRACDQRAGDDLAWAGRARHGRPGPPCGVASGGSLQVRPWTLWVADQRRRCHRDDRRCRRRGRLTLPGGSGTVRAAPRSANFRGAVISP